MYYTLVTGASGVFGKCFCTELAKQKNNLIISGRSQEKLDELKQELSSFGVDILAFACDLSVMEERAKLFEFISPLKINKLILVAGNDNQMGIENYSQEKVCKQIRANFESAVDLSRFCLPKMDKGGWVLAISSLTAILPMPYFAVYSASKRAMLDYFSAIRYEFSDLNISVALPSSMPTRPDVILDIKKQGLTGKLASQKPQKVAKICLKKVKKNKRIILVGLYNKIVYFFNKITPLGLRCRLIAKKFKNKRKEKF